jgi:hypothetical protein
MFSQREKQASDENAGVIAGDTGAFNFLDYALRGNSCNAMQHSYHGSNFKLTCSLHLYILLNSEPFE